MNVITKLMIYETSKIINFNLVIFRNFPLVTVYPFAINISMNKKIVCAIASNKRA
jgi:hypothetical protein